MIKELKVDLKDLTIENIGSWPLSIRIVFTFLAFSIIFILGIFLFIKPQFENLGKKQAEQVELQDLFKGKAQKAIVLLSYKQQVEQMEVSFRGLIDQLPSNAEIPNLVEEISKMGIANGLEFDLIKPGPEQEKEFYSELPISIVVKGGYHQLAVFISNLASLQRIVTIGNFVIQKNAGEGKGLVMEMTADTYRYLETPNEKTFLSGEKK